MAIVFLFNVMVARKVEIDSKYPGGMPQFRSDWLARPPERWCEDEHLLAFSSMGFYFKNVADRLRSLGIDVLITDESVPPSENVKRCSWIEWDIHEKHEHKSPDGFVQVHEVPRHWLRGSPPGELAVFGRKKHIA